MKKRSSEHTRIQRQGKERDKYTCQICGSKDRSEGHHIFDYAYVGAADRENIVTLCHDCHNKVHKGLINLLKF